MKGAKLENRKTNMEVNKLTRREREWFTQNKEIWWVFLRLNSFHLKQTVLCQTEESLWCLQSCCPVKQTRVHRKPEEASTQITRQSQRTQVAVGSYPYLGQTQTHTRTHTLPVHCDPPFLSSSLGKQLPDRALYKESENIQYSAQPVILKSNTPHATILSQVLSRHPGM